MRSSGGMLDGARLLDDADVPEEKRARLRMQVAEDLERRALRSSPLHLLAALCLGASDVPSAHPGLFEGFIAAMVVVLVARVASYRLNRGRAPGRRRDVVFLVPWLASSAVFSAFCTAIAFLEPGRWESVAMNAAAGLGGLAAIMQFAAYGRAVLAYALVLTGPPAVAAFVASGLHGGAGLMLGFMWLVFLVLVLPSLRDQHRDFWTSLVAGAVLEQRAERLAITAAERTAFFAAVSHDVRTPMNGILGMARELLARSHDDEQRRALSSIVAASEGLLDTLNDVLDAAKLEAGRLTLDERHFSPRRVIDEVITLASATARQHQVRLEQRVDASVPDAACGDDRRLRQVLANLVANAVRFTSKGTVTVRARAAREGDEVRLFVDVEDTGRGFSPEERERLFVRFAQLDDRAGGTGLGLSNVRDLVGLMGGAVEAHSDGVGKGAVFHFHVALKAADLVPVFDAPGPRVLLAEDDALSARVAAAQLTRLGCHVDVVANGAEAVEAVARGAYDAVVLDCLMPVMDGMAAARAIRATSTIPILALTANADSARAACLDAGMNDVLLKPATAEALASALQALLRRSVRAAE